MLASMLGSDVPFFLKDQAAVGSGRGEKLEYFDYKLPWWLVIVYPNIHVNTGEAYSALGRTNAWRDPVNFKKAVLESFDRPELLKEKIVNDFEDVVFKKYPEIRLLKDSMYDFGAIFSLMSGSGSSVFGLFKTEQDARTALEGFYNYQAFLSEPQR
jgi:4-diphosphocytidyl-2-C-methyl-D-erythritol kinase